MTQPFATVAKRLITNNETDAAISPGRAGQRPAYLHQSLQYSASWSRHGLFGLLQSSFLFGRIHTVAMFARNLSRCERKCEAFFIDVDYESSGVLDGTYDDELLVMVKSRYT